MPSPRSFAIALGGTRDWITQKFPPWWKWTRGNDSNPPGPPRAQPMAYHSFQTPSVAKHGPARRFLFWTEFERRGTRKTAKLPVKCLVFGNWRSGGRCEDPDIFRVHFWEIQMEKDISEKLFSGSLTLLSILLGIFTFSLVNAMKLKGTYPEVYPWYAITAITGTAISLSSIICILSFFSYHNPTSKTRRRSIIVLFVFVLITCGIGVPLIGLWIFLIY